MCVTLLIQTHPRHKGEDVVLLVFNGVFGVFLLTFLWAAEPNRPGLHLLLPPTYMGQTVTAAEKRFMLNHPELLINATYQIEFKKIAKLQMLI